MPDYSQSKIYKLTSNHTDKIYVGTTTGCIWMRRRDLKSRYKKNKPIGRCAELFCYNDVKVELIENFPCYHRIQLNKRQQYWANVLNAINK